MNRVEDSRAPDPREGQKHAEIVAGRGRPNSGVRPIWAVRRADTVLLSALLGVLLASGAVALRNLLKISVTRFYLRELASVDEQIRIEIGKPEADVFRGAARWPEWERQHFAPIALSLTILLGGLLVVIPVMILIAIGQAWHVAVYT
jgi:hypothetical protein